MGTSKTIRELDRKIKWLVDNYLQVPDEDVLEFIGFPNIPEKPMDTVGDGLNDYFTRDEMDAIVKGAKRKLHRELIVANLKLKGLKKLPNYSPFIPVDPTKEAKLTDFKK